MADNYLAYLAMVLYQPFKKGQSREDYDNRIVNLLKIYDVDIVFLIGWVSLITGLSLGNYFAWGDKATSSSEME